VCLLTQIMKGHAPMLGKMLMQVRGTTRLEGKKDFGHNESLLYELLGCDDLRVSYLS